MARQPRAPAGTPRGGQFAPAVHPEADVGLSAEAPTGRPSWRADNADAFQQTIATAARQMGLWPIAVEKDYWVCQALRGIESTHPGEVVFKGGTSLEKIRLIHRFSEDLDLLVIGEYPSGHAAERALKSMCAAAQEAVPGSQSEKVRSGGRPGTLHRAVRLHLPHLGASAPSTALADPGSILIELGQSGGPRPVTRRTVTSLLGRQLADAGAPIENFEDLAGFEVDVLHPGRTLLEKLLRANNYAGDPARREELDSAARIGRQFYDVWALLGDDDTLALLGDRERADAVLTDCMRVSLSFRPDLAPPAGGFAASVVFDSEGPLAQELRSEHDKAMAGLYYGPGDPPTFDDVIARVREHADLLNLTPDLKQTAQPD